MRPRKLLAAVVVGLGLSVAFAGGAFTGTASAQTPTTTKPATEGSTPDTSKAKDEFAIECIEKLEAGGTADDCQKAPSLILPATNEMVWGGLSFVILFALLAKFAWPGIKKGMEGRTERIRADLSAADEAKAGAQRVLDDYKAQLADAKNESARIIEEARQQADALKKDQEQRLQTELAEMRARAAADVESAKQQAIADLRTEVANLAIGAAEVVVQRNLDRATQSQLVDAYINQVASRAN